MSYVLTPLGDRGITIRLGDGISGELSDDVARLANGISSSSIRGVSDVVSSYASLGVFYNPLEISYADLRRRLETVMENAGRHEVEHAAEGRLVNIPVAYNGEDIDEVCRRTRLTIDELIGLHTGRQYRVFVVGFVPGFAYLGPLDPRLIIPRRESPRKRVPPGSVAIAEGQTGVYPSETPGGWHLIGTTTEKMFDPSRESPALLRVGDMVQFEAIR